LDPGLAWEVQVSLAFVVISAVTLGAASVQVLSVVGEGVSVAGEGLGAGVPEPAVEQVLEEGTAVVVALSVAVVAVVVVLAVAVAVVAQAAVQIFLLVVVLVLLSAVAVVLCHMAQCQ